MISRRAMVSATLTGIPVGIAGGFLMRTWTGSGASIRFLGRHQTMVALLDTGTTRAIFLLGEPDVAMLDNLPQLLTFGRSRTDLLIGSHRWLTTNGLRAAVDLHTITTLSLQADSSLPPIRGNVFPISNGQMLQLGDECEVTISVSAISADSEDHPGILITILCRETAIMLASSAGALNEHWRGVTVLAFPGKIDATAVLNQHPALFVGTEMLEDDSQPALLTHASEPVRLTIGNGSVTHRGDQFSS